MSNIHEVDVLWQQCEYCNYKCKDKSNLQRHLKDIHELGDIKSFKCNLCNYVAKHKNTLDRHFSNIHDVNIKWHNCDQCDYKCKQKYDLKKHLEYVHDIGTYTCDFCMQNRNSSIVYTEKSEKHNICRSCYNKRTGKTTRVEHEWSNYLDKHFGTEFLLSSDKRLYGSKCQLYRPDKIYASYELVIHKECDEHEHKYNNGNYECDEKRISDIYDEFENKNAYVVTRWNPDHYTVPDDKKRLNRKERLELDLYITQKIQENVNKFPKLFIIFICYSEDSERLTENIPYIMVWDKSDIDIFLV